MALRCDAIPELVRYCARPLRPSRGAEPILASPVWRPIALHYIGTSTRRRRRNPTHRMGFSNGQHLQTAFPRGPEDLPRSAAKAVRHGTVACATTPT
jgi:hypothetical protein